MQVSALSKKRQAAIATYVEDFFPLFLSLVTPHRHFCFFFTVTLSDSETRIFWYVFSPQDISSLSGRPPDPLPTMVNPQVVITLVAGGAAAVVAMAGGFLAWLRTPGLDQTQPKSLLSPASIICHSHEMLAQLQPSAPDKPATLFSILRLDPSKSPFDPADDCAYPYSPNYKAAKRAVTDAWAKTSDSHDGDMREWRDVFSMAAFTLLNDTSRIIYMKNVLPNLIKAKGKGGSDKVLQEFCDKM